MITLITGVPGTGKTCYVVAMIARMAYEGRPLLVHGINNLKFDHTVLGCDNPACDLCTGEEKNKIADLAGITFPDSLIVIDEAQRYYGDLNGFEFLETHRHKGVNVILITQTPLSLHQKVRGLVGKHIHLHQGWKGRKLIEYSTCQTSPLSKTVMTQGVKQDYTPNKKIYPLYKSAELHIKSKYRLPAVVKMMGLAVIALGYLFYSLFMSGNSMIGNSISSVVAGDVDTNITKSMDVSNNIKTAKTPQPEPEDTSMNEVLRPAPVADNNVVQAITQAYTPRACIHSQSTDSCNCYSDKGTRVPLSYIECIDFVENEAISYPPDRPDSDNRAIRMSRPAASAYMVDKQP